MSNIVRFTPEDRSTFSYWFAHWCAYQMTALNLKCWKPKYLLHDIEKPWLRLFMPYKKVQKFHRTHNNHHYEKFIMLYINGISYCKEFDWEGMLIDYECSRFTKTAHSLDAIDTVNKVYNQILNNDLKPFIQYYISENTSNFDYQRCAKAYISMATRYLKRLNILS